eukprot:2328611-Pyramimonas_sp.AAC.1
MQKCKEAVGTKQDQHQQFFDCRRWLIDQHQSGNIKAKKAFQPAKQEVQQTKSFGVKKKAPGRLLLKTKYVELYGDPATNGTNHKEMRTEWKMEPSRTAC